MQCYHEALLCLTEVYHLSFLAYLCELKYLRSWNIRIALEVFKCLYLYKGDSSIGKQFFMKCIYSGCMQPDGSSEHLNCILLQSAKDSPLNAQKSGKENVVKQVEVHIFWMYATRR